jgi:amino acid transporter
VILDVYRAITLALTLIALATWVLWLFRHPNKWGYAMWIILWLLNILVFYTSILFFGVRDPEFLNAWSTIIRWQALISIIGAAVIWRNGNHNRQVTHV